MTLTAADVARYEERAAKGEKPRLPWKVCGYYATLLGKYRIVEVEASMPDGSVICRTSLPVTPPSKSRPADIVCALAADDALLAFARPLLERPVVGPFSVRFRNGEWAVGQHVPLAAGGSVFEGIEFYDDEEEANAIARVRNEAWQRRQKENKP